VAIATSTDANLHPTYSDSLRPPLSWLSVSFVALTMGFRPQLHAVATIVAAKRLTASMFCGGRYSNPQKMKMNIRLVKKRV
jgi:hypothetical protein